MAEPEIRVRLPERLNVPDLVEGLRRWLSFYNNERFHTSLPGKITPREMYESGLNL